MGILTPMCIDLPRPLSFTMIPFLIATRSAVTLSLAVHHFVTVFPNPAASTSAHVIWKPPLDAEVTNMLVSNIEPVFVMPSLFGL